MMVKKGASALELKQRVVASLRKVGDRDTHQMGADELERAAEALSADEISPFLSCIAPSADSDADTAPVRRECVRLMAVLARAHRRLLTPPQLSKMLSALLRRLRDPDTLLRDACVDACGALSLSFADAMVRPLFQALGEQNRYAQAGSALCLARVIDASTSSALLSPSALLPQMLPRVLKLLKNPHFMAKPALIQLITTILQANGGASTEDAFSAALSAILESLKSTDWTIRKAASVALATIAVGGITTPPLASFKTTCVASLESCRFDKVKPVRDVIMHALQSWKTLPGTGSPQPSEAGSSTKENMAGVYNDVSSASDGGWIDVSFRKTGPVSSLSANSTSSSKKRAPLAVRKNRQDNVQACQHPIPHDWHVEISLPKARTASLVPNRLVETDGSCTEKAFARTEDGKAGTDVKYDYDSADDKPECSTMSDVVNESFETKHVAHDCLGEGVSANLIRNNHRSTTEEVESEDLRMQDHKSLDSTVTDLSSHGIHSCCLHASNELDFIKKKLFEIDAKQSNLLDLLQVSMCNSADNISALQLKFRNLEHAVEKIVQNVSQSENYHSRASSNNLKKIHSSASTPRLSTSTPRPSVESNYRQPSLLSLSNKEIWGENASSRSQSNTSFQEGTELRRDPTLSVMRNPISKGSQKNMGRNVHSTGINQKKETRSLRSISACKISAKPCNLDHRSASWKKIKELLCAGDAESAYVEVLCSGDDLVLLELMDRTGPILEILSHETADLIISTLTTHFQNQRFTETIFPWFQQVVDLSSAHKPGQLVLSSKTRMDLLFTLREVSGVEYIHPADRISIAECASKLRQVWGDPTKRKMLANKGF